MPRNPRLIALVSAGLVGSAVGTANAQPYVINISGATLLRNLVNAPAASNDYIDVDNNGVARIFSTNQQLAPFFPVDNTPPASAHWVIQYRAVGSVNGLQEFIDFSRVFLTTADGVELRSTAAAEGAWVNRTNYINAGLPTDSGIFTPENPCGLPFRTRTDGTYIATRDLNNSGVQIDLAVVDVPTSWSVFQAGGDPAFGRKPGQPGYGRNPRRSVNKQGGTEGADLSSFLADIGDLNAFDPANPAAVNANTIFDTSIAIAPVAPIMNLGVGLAQVTISDMQHMFVTGRRANGENLMIVTRDVGSGTRNAWTNSIGVDPSWGVGENVGGLSNLAAFDILGPNFLPSNKGGSSRSQSTVQNHRLGFGYTGGDNAIPGVNAGNWEIPAVRNDIYGGTAFVRPTIQTVLNNDANGWVIAGPAVFVSLGDPRAAPVNKGGNAGNTNPAMRNVEAAAYLNNITRSIAAFAGAPGSDQTLFTPGEFLAANFVLTAAADFVQDPTDPTNLIANPALNPSLKEFAFSSGPSVYRNLQAFGAITLNGKVPTRTTGVVYSDGVANGSAYINQAGNPVNYNTNLTSRNRIAGDFNGDGQRTLADAVGMVAAWRQRNGGPVWVAPNGTGPIAGAPGSDAVIEILGDFNGDGSFDAADVRYWADGLALDANGRLNRRLGFEAVDNAFGGNFFGTTLATGASYQPGFSRADVSGPANRHARGFAPIAADGVIDAHDIDYVYAQFKRNPFITGGTADWNVLAEAAHFDLSADMNGDLIVDQSDVDAIVLDILGTQYGDANLDGVVDAADRAIVIANLGQPGGWAQGDFNGDGIVNELDLAFIDGAPCPADFNNDDQVNTADITAFLSAWFAARAGGPVGGSDFNADGQVNTADITAFLSAWFAARAGGC